MASVQRIRFIGAHILTPEPHHLRRIDDRCVKIVHIEARILVLVLGKQFWMTRHRDIEHLPDNAFDAFVPSFLSENSSLFQPMSAYLPHGLNIEAVSPDCHQQTLQQQ